MDNEPRINFQVYLKHHFGKPSVINWSFPLFMLALTTLVFFIFRCVFKKYDEALPVTSIVGFTLLISLIVIATLILPTVYLGRGITSKIIGEYSGIGALIIALVSGLPLMLIKTSLHNLGMYLWLRLDLKIVFPLLFYYFEDSSTASTILTILTETIIPAFGCSLFFFGLLWSRFRSTEKTLGGIIIAIAFAFWSMDPMMFIPLLIIGLWCSFLRTTTNNIWGPLLCLISIKLSDYLFIGTLSRVDILSVQTYSDINPTYLYASLPALIFGLIILIFLRSFLLEFKYKNIIPEKEEANDRTIPAFSKGINLSVVLSIIIFIMIFILLCKGVHI